MAESYRSAQERIERSNKKEAPKIKKAFAKGESGEYISPAAKAAGIKPRPKANGTFSGFGGAPSDSVWNREHMGKKRSTSDGYMPRASKSKDPYSTKLTAKVKALGKGKTIMAGKTDRIN